MSLPAQCTRVVLNERPKTAHIADTTFRIEKIPMNDLLPKKPTDVLVRVDYCSLDPAMRGWLDDRRSYIPPVAIGATMRAGAIGTVVRVHPKGSGKFKEGDIVKGSFGWTDYIRINETNPDTEKLSLPRGTTPLDYLGILGGSGMTAYFGILDICKIKPGDTVVVSGAAGSVGSIACQLAKIQGAGKVIAIAGSPEKCKWLEQDLGVDKALNYKSPTFANEFKKSVGYLNVFFDNVGGDILDLALSRLEKGARIALCGGISDYGKKPKGLQGYLNLVTQRAKLEGFIVTDYQDQFRAAEEEMGRWFAEGKLKRKFHVVEGLEKCPSHLNDLFKGVNTGKMVVKISKDGPQAKL